MSELKDDNMNSLNDINSKANDIIKRLKNTEKHRFTMTNRERLKQEMEADKLSEDERINKAKKLFEQPQPVVRDSFKDFEEAVEESANAKEVDNAVAFINSLELSPKLSMAMAYIIASKKENRVGNLEEAIATIRAEINK